jgi:hypothetical protein
MMRVIVWRLCLERSVGSVTIGLAIDLRFSAALMLPAAIVIVTGRITMMTSPDMTLVPILTKTFLMITGRMVVIPESALWLKAVNNRG